MNRRQFLVRTAALAAAPLVLQIVASCGDDEPAAPTNEFSFTGTGDHVHTGVITCSQLNGGVNIDVTSNVGGFPSHAHTFAISSGQLASIAQGNVVTITTNDLHPHTWTISKPVGTC